MYAQHHHHPHPLLLHGRSQAPLPRSTDMTPGSGSASPVRSSSMRTGTAREKSRSGCCGGVRCGGLFRGLQAQITGTEEDPQQIVGQSLLSCLQNPVPYLSRLQRIHLFQRSKLCFSATQINYYGYPSSRDYPNKRCAMYKIQHPGMPHKVRCPPAQYSTRRLLQQRSEINYAQQIRQNPRADHLPGWQQILHCHSWILSA